MTERRRMSAIDRRHSIATAARALFAHNGFDATTTRELAKAAHVSDALLYRHFADKQAVLEQVVDEAMAVFDGMPPLERLRHLPLDELFRVLGSGFLERVGTNLDSVVVLITEHRVIRDARFAAFVHTAATALGAELAARIDTVDAREGYLAARSFFGALISFVLLQRVLGLDAIDPVQPEQYLDRLVRTTAKGLVD